MRDEVRSKDYWVQFVQAKLETMTLTWIVGVAFLLFGLLFIVLVPHLVMVSSETGKPSEEQPRSSFLFLVLHVMGVSLLAYLMSVGLRMGVHLWVNHGLIKGYHAGGLEVTPELRQGVGKSLKRWRWWHRLLCWVRRVPFDKAYAPFLRPEGNVESEG